MTQHVRNTYREHRGRTWAIVLAVMALAAAVVIPFASGARPATDSFTDNVTVCAGTTQATFTMTLTNTSKTAQNLGSADLYAPANIAVSSAAFAAGSGGGGAKKLSVSAYPNAVSLDPHDSTTTGRSLIHVKDLQLAGGSSVAIQVTASVTGSGTKYWYSLAKQSNDFNPGDLDLSNSFSNPTGDPFFAVATCTLAFVTQPPSPWQKGKTAADQGASPVAVALYAGSVQQYVTGLTAPTLSSTPSEPSNTPPYFSFGSAGVATDGLSWTYPDAKPTTAAPSGLYTLTATRGSATATSQQFRVTTSLCLSGSTCDVTSDLSGLQIQAGISNTLPTSLTIDFSTGAEAKCTSWNRAYIGTAANPTYFPGVVLDYTWGNQMLQLVYRIRNSEWVQTNVSRGNSDIEICAGAKHEDASLNGYPAPDGTGDPFTGKDGVVAEWHPEDGLFWGVLARVSNPNKVKPGGDPAVCASGTQDLPTGTNGATETWRTWTICIPKDWDWKNFG